jgi:hypothetical protein
VDLTDDSGIPMPVAYLFVESLVLGDGEVVPVVTLRMAKGQTKEDEDLVLRQWRKSETTE